MEAQFTCVIYSLKVGVCITVSWKVFILSEVGRFSIARHNIWASGSLMPSVWESTINDSFSAKFLDHLMPADPVGKLNQSSRNFLVIALAIRPGSAVQRSSMMSSSMVKTWRCFFSTAFIGSPICWIWNLNSRLICFSRYSSRLCCFSLVVESLRTMGMATSSCSDMSDSDISTQWSGPNSVICSKVYLPESSSASASMSRFHRFLIDRSLLP